MASAQSSAPPSGVEIVGSGSAIPEKRLTNADLERVMDTSDEWIVQRTGIHERRVIDHERETLGAYALEAGQKALADAGMAPTDIDMVMVATMTPDMPTPGIASVLTHQLGMGTIGAMDLNAACSGFVYGMNFANAAIQSGMARNILLVGADAITRHIDYSTYGRGAAILFGDAAGAVVVRATDRSGPGLLAQAMHSDGGGAEVLYVPCMPHHIPEEQGQDDRKITKVQMNGQAVFRFAVKTFPQLIEETLEMVGLGADDVQHYVCHQSNRRILQAARDRFGLAEDKLHVNIGELGNTVAASVPLVFDELRRAGRVEPGHRVMFLGFGAGLTWGSSLWQI
ncbi:MAG: beta-ketoacyl-ACP synthase III [Planctomycetota bacterium]